MIGNTCLSQPGNHSRDMVVEPVHSVSVLGSITFCLLDVVGLCLEKVIFLRCLPLAILCCILTGYFKISLPISDFEKSLASMILCPDFVPCVNLFGSGIATTFLRVYPAMPLFAMISYPPRSSTDV